ncbi:helix-turn-helix domain-containing protein [Spirillospora sp. CA-255316]
MNVISTAETPAGEEFSFWREASSKACVPHDVRCEPRLESRFRSQVEVSEFGPLQVTLLTTTPYSFHRTPKLIRQADPDAFNLNCAVRGRGMMAQEGRQADFDRGDLVLSDTSHPFQAEFAPDVPANQMVMLRFPRSSLPLPHRDLRRLTAVRIPGDYGIGALSSQFLLQLAQRIDEFSPSEAARLSTLALDVLTAALASALEKESAVPPHARRRALLAQIHAFIQANLGDARLTPEAIAAAHHISLRYLHKLFQQDGHTVASWIRRRRLERCRHDLADPLLVNFPIGALAARWGFSSHAQFSRAFRNAYGISPLQFREQQAGTTNTTVR